MGTTNENWMPQWSATAPWVGGTRAPPRMAMTSSEEAWLLSGPRPSMASEKIFDHMTEQNRPTQRMAHLAVSPVLLMPVINRQMITPLNRATMRWGLDPLRKKATSKTARKTP